MLQMSSSSNDFDKSKNNNNNVNNNNNTGRSRNKKKGADGGSGSGRPFMFFSSILKKKKYLEIDEIREMKNRTRSEPSVVCYGTQLGLVPPQSTVSVSTLSLTPGQCGRNLDHDMQQLRMSRADNPYLQKVLASRESLDCADDNLADDDTILIQDLNSQMDNPDPFQMKDVQENMIRSPPPISWGRHSIFNFPNSQDNFIFSHDNNNTITSQSSEDSGHSAIYFSENFGSAPSHSSSHHGSSHGSSAFRPITQCDLRNEF